MASPGATAFGDPAGLPHKRAKEEADHGFTAPRNRGLSPIVIQIEHHRLLTRAQGRLRAVRREKTVVCPLLMSEGLGVTARAG